MKVSNNLSAQMVQKPKFSTIINSNGYKKLIMNTLGDEKKSQRFVTAIVSAVSANNALAECDASTIVSAALLGESLGLSPSPQLGQYYLVPYNDSKKGQKVAQFQLGYRGMLQLAQRSGEYKRINAMAVKEGELVSYNPFDDEIILRYSDGDRDSLRTVGYYAMFEYHNGFKKIIYWSREKMELHARRYSKSYSSPHSFWQKDFDAMACKTMLRQLLSKWGIMSIEMTKAYESDMGVIGENGQVDYIDNPQEEFPVPAPSEEESFAEYADDETFDEFAEILNG